MINGELIPYEAGYTPPRTVEYGQLIYPAKKSDEESQSRKKSIGPFSKSDNLSGELDNPDAGQASIGPFSVRDMFSSRSSQQHGNIGPFSVADNSKSTNSKLIDYIKRINDQEVIIFSARQSGRRVMVLFILVSQRLLRWSITEGDRRQADHSATDADPAE